MPRGSATTWSGTRGRGVLLPYRSSDRQDCPSYIWLRHGHSFPEVPAAPSRMNTHLSCSRFFLPERSSGAGIRLCTGMEFQKRIIVLSLRRPKIYQLDIVRYELLRIFSGLRSLCITCLLWIYSRTSQSWETIFRESFLSDIGSIDLSGSPSIHCMIMQCPSSG